VCLSIGLVQTSCTKRHIPPWKGLEVAYNLTQYIDWSSTELQSILKGNTPQHTAAITGLIEVDLEQQQCHVPYCFTYDTLTLDINTWCSIIHTLQILNYFNAATNLAFYLSHALIDLYHHHGNTKMSDVPVVHHWSLEHKEWKSTADNKNAGSANSHENMDVDSSSLSIWPTDCLMSLRSIAFLYDILSSNSTLGNELIHVSDIKETDSLLFQLGIIGLVMPKLPLASSRQEVLSI